MGNNSCAEEPCTCAWLVLSRLSAATAQCHGQRHGRGCHQCSVPAVAKGSSQGSATATRGTGGRQCSVLSASHHQGELTGHQQQESRSKARGSPCRVCTACRVQSAHMQQEVGGPHPAKHVPEAPPDKQAEVHSRVAGQGRSWRQTVQISASNNECQRGFFKCMDEGGRACHTVLHAAKGEAHSAQQVRAARALLQVWVMSRKCMHIGR